MFDMLENVKDVRDAGVTFIGNQGNESFLSYGELFVAASRCLGLLQSKGVCRGDELVFQVEDNSTYLIFFWACILGGIIPVPLSVGKNDDHRKKVFTVWKFLRHPFLLSADEQLAQLTKYAADNEQESVLAEMSARFVATAMPGHDFQALLYRPVEEELAFIQFSSGSTGNPKGVMLTHRNLITNMEDIGEAAAYHQSDCMLSWMPLTHDMGMIGFHLSPLLYGMQHYLLQTDIFIRRPALWLEKASEHKATILCSPNFGLEYTTRHCVKAPYDQFDLSQVRILYNGAEPISESICKAFLSAFSRHQLKENVMCPVYGLAEASLAVSIPVLKEDISYLRLDRNRLNVGDRMMEPARTQDAITFIGVGKPIRHCAVRIVTGAEEIAPEATIGRIQISGKNVTAGYYNNVAATELVIGADNWLTTGDLGFFKDGMLYVTGREKDVLFVNSRNYYSHDIEQIATGITGIELNKIVVTSVYGGGGKQGEIVAFVFHRGPLTQFLEIERSLRALISHHFGFELGRVLPVKSVPRTTSGKLQRYRLAEQLLAGDFDTAEKELTLLKEQAAYPAATATEQQLMIIWKQLTGQQAEGRSDFFADLGGNSLLAAEMSMMIRQSFSVELPVNILYSKRTIAELAAEISHRKRAGEDIFPPIRAVQDAAFYPLAPVQQRIGYFWQMNQESLAYNVSVVFSITGKLDAARLEQSIREIVARHDALRMSVRMNSEGQVLQVHDHVIFKLEMTQLTEEDSVDELIRSAICPFDLSVAPLLNGHLFRVSGNNHLLLLDFHHIVADGISVSIFIDELLKLYHGIGLPELPVRYADYAAWDRERSRSPALERERAYWKQQLQGEVPLLEMPYDYLRPTKPDTAGRKLSFRLDPSQLTQLKKLAAENNCTLHLLFFTLYALLLSKYQGKERMVIGIPVSGRRHPDLLPLIGMFVNNLPISAEISGEEQFTSLLQKMKYTMEAAIDHQDLPFSDIADLCKSSGAGRNAVFDTMFVYQNMRVPSLENAEWQITRRDFDTGISKFDITMEIFEDAVAPAYNIEYATHLFSEDKIHQLSRHFQRLISIVLENAEIKVAQMCLLSDDDYQAVITEFNKTLATYPQHKRIEVLIREQAARTPHAVAVSYGERDLTYGELSRLSAILAYKLREKGIDDGDVVAILLPRSPELIIYILAVLKSGACYLPVDPDLPADRKAFVFKSSKCKLILTGAEGYNDPEGTPWLYWNGNANGEEPVYNKENADTEDPAYVIYTSGTTGNPKGVVVSHRALVNYITWAVGMYANDHQSSSDFPLFTSVSFDLAVTSIFVPLVTGNRVIIYEEQTGGSLLEEVIRDNRSDIVKLTPSHLRLLRDRQLLPINTPGRIRSFIVGGEQLESGLAMDIYRLFGGHIRIYNEYGPTEATVGCMIYEFNPTDAFVNVPVGKPISNTRIYLLDKHLIPVPVGVHGEIYIAGDGLACGYLHDQELTGARFVEDPFVPDARMYKTGDRGVRTNEGTIEFLGRFDRQVKIDGYRVEPAEIEYHLSGYKEIAQAVVTVVKDTLERFRLVAYYRAVSVPGADLDIDNLIQYLAERMPYYMIPMHFIGVETFPLTANGKLDIDALPAPDMVLHPTAGKSMTDMERQLAEAWEKIMGIEKVVADSNFFHLGGDSIKAFQIKAYLLDRGISVDAKDILTYHTVARVALHAHPLLPDQSMQMKASGERAYLPIEAWFFERAFKHPAFYHQTLLLELRENAQTHILEQAFQILISRHDGLRLNYDPAKNCLCYNDRHLSDLFLLSECSGATTAELERIKNTFDLTRDLLIKAAVIEEGKNKQLLITAHHLVIDGVSWRVLLADLLRIYESLQNETEVPPVVISMPAGNWLQSLHESGNRMLPAEIAYWKEAERCTFSLPVADTLIDWRYIHRRTVSRHLGTDETDFLLKEANVPFSTEVPVLLLTALGNVLQEWTGEEQLLVMMEGHGRQFEHREVPATIGWFTALYPLLFYVKGDTTGDQIRCVKQQYAKVPQHGIGYGIGRYLKEYFKKEEDSKTAILFNYIGQVDHEFNNRLFSYNHAATGRETHEENEMYCLFEMNFLVLSGRLQMELSFNETAHEPALVSDFIDRYFGTLRSMLHYLKELQEVQLSHSDFKLANLDEHDMKTLFG